MKKKLLICAIAFLGAFILSCSSVGGESSSAKLNIRVGGKDAVLNVKSGGVYYGNVISTAPGKPNVQTFCHYIVVANYEMDTTNLATMKKPLTSADQMRVMFSLTGEDGTNTDSPFKVGIYDAAGDKINEVRSLSVITQEDGKDKEEDFDTMSGSSKTAGTVKITSVTKDSVSGEIDVTEGDRSVKGTFTARLPQKK
jgi:hypothetical protein